MSRPKYTYLGTYTEFRNPQQDSAPHICPICHGKGEVSAEFYEVYPSTSINKFPVTCKSCGGRGIVWKD